MSAVFACLRVSVIVLRVSLKLDTCNFRQCRRTPSVLLESAQRRCAKADFYHNSIRTKWRSPSTRYWLFGETFPARFNFHPNRPITPIATHTKVITFLGRHLEGLIGWERENRRWIFLLQALDDIRRINGESKFQVGNVLVAQHISGNVKSKDQVVLVFNNRASRTALVGGVVCAFLRLDEMGIVKGGARKAVYAS